MSILITDAKTRADIEAWTEVNTFPNIIKFIEDKEGNFVTSREVMTNPAYTKYFETDLKELQTKAVLIGPNPKDADIPVEPKATTQGVK